MFWHAVDEIIYDFFVVLVVQIFLQQLSGSENRQFSCLLTQMSGEPDCALVVWCDAPVREAVGRRLRRVLARLGQFARRLRALC